MGVCIPLVQHILEHEDLPGVVNIPRRKVREREQFRPVDPALGFGESRFEGEPAVADEAGALHAVEGAPLDPHLCVGCGGVWSDEVR